MSQARAGLLFAVFAALAACNSTPEPLDGQDPGSERDVLPVTIEFNAEENMTLVDEGFVPEIATQPDPIRVRRGQTLEWRFAGGPWMVLPTPLSPFDQNVIRGAAGDAVQVTVRPDAMLGVYKSIIAVAVGGQVYVTDPHFVVGR